LALGGFLLGKFLDDAVAKANPRLPGIAFPYRLWASVLVLIRRSKMPFIAGLPPLIAPMLPFIAKFLPVNAALPPAA
jgi:hypothetical protein